MRTNTLLTNQQTEKTKNKKVLWNENKVLPLEIHVLCGPSMIEYPESFIDGPHGMHMICNSDWIRLILKIPSR